MQVHELRRPAGSRKVKRIKGRGNGSGRGKTSCRGMNGQKAHSGRGVMTGSEGGQMALIRRLPKVGFRAHRPVIYQLVKISDLTRFQNGDVVDAKVLRSTGLIHNIYKPFKILGNGELKCALTVKATAFSKPAAKKIADAGGTAEIFDKAELKTQTEKE